MMQDEIEAQPGASERRFRDRVVDWLGAQGALLLTVYMCAAVAAVAFLLDAAR
ncbi:hypothetical protein OVY29_09360 [Sphingopyxis sp. SE2]|jgi:hypothetical protein|uniref:hypothetical protein n=1 Tax=unclassified Sphingopyxis TaxID=2614943 RepID=UPI00050E3809|nr:MULTISPECIES: hypothetical protein [unclassified Sphingopyxis]KGB55155.1 hypothetical protein FG95_02623 [Sphingopyxis sp. LC363]MDT7528866.1 hypothetical protein [Sphingopyxis sp. SE2]